MLRTFTVVATAIATTQATRLEGQNGMGMKQMLDAR